MHYLDESHLFLFLIQVGVLLGLARGAGMLLSRIGQPSITGEILVGVLLGPTVLGRTLPEFQRWLFPADTAQQGMMETVSWLGILFFLLVTGLETDLTATWRQRKDALVISMSDLVLPMVIAFVPCMFLPESYLAAPGTRLLFALFVATIMTISALPVTARVMQELDIYKSDTGLLIMGALTINDLAGWVIFAVILGLATGSGMTPMRIGAVVAGTLAFAGVFLTVGRKLTDRAFAAFHKWGLPDPGAALTLLSVIGLVGGAITLKLGIHALFGFFIVGIMAGEARSLSENTRYVISQMVRAVLVPLFFATLGLKIDFARHFDTWMVLFIMAVGVVGRFVGAWVGVTLTRQPRRHRHLIAVGHTPGGEMQIVVGALAVEYRVISEPVFVAIVFGAVFSSILLGPWMKWALGHARIGPLARGLSRKTTVAALKGTSREAVVRELCGLAARRIHGADIDSLVSAVMQRENVKGTAIGYGVATPHAYVASVADTVVAVGRSPTGLDWNAPDGSAVRLVFLTLAPADAADRQLEIQRAVAALAGGEGARTSLLSAQNDEDFWGALVQVAPVADDTGRAAEGK